jgi:hypothetical protein
VLATDESRLPNPKKITITGASTAEYDGSDEVEVQVPYKTSQLENDSGFMTTAPVSSVNRMTGDVTLPTVVKITITEQADGTIEPDLPHEDILAVYNAGNTVCCEYKGRLLPLIVASEAICSFGCVHSGKVYAVNITRASAVASIVPLTSGDSGSAPADAVLHTPQDLTPEKQAQARQNIGAVPAPDSAVVGQTIVVKEVDENGKPTAWEAANFPSGGSSAFRFQFTVEENVSVVIIPFPVDLNKTVIFNIHGTYPNVEKELDLKTITSGKWGSFALIPVSSNSGSNYFAMKQTDNSHMYGSSASATYTENARFNDIQSSVSIPEGTNSFTIVCNTEGTTIPSGTTFDIWGVYAE